MKYKGQRYSLMRSTRAYSVLHKSDDVNSEISHVGQQEKHTGTKFNELKQPVGVGH